MKRNEDLINHLIDVGYLKTDKIIDTFRDIDRKYFATEEQQRVVYEDVSLAVGNGQRTSPPFLAALVLELAQIRGGEKIYVVGSGAGWILSMMAYLNRMPSDAPGARQGKVVCVEIFPPVAQKAKQNIAASGLVQEGEIEIHVGDGKKGFPSEAPFHKIITTGALDEVPREWKDELIIGGKIIYPTQSTLIVLEKEGKEDFQKREYFGFTFDRLLQ